MNLSEIVSRPRAAPKFKAKTNMVQLERAVAAAVKKYGPAEDTEEDPRDLVDRLIDFEERYASSHWKGYPWHKASDLFRAFFLSDLSDDPRWVQVSRILLKTFEDTDRISFCRAAIDIYVSTYDEESDTLDRLCESLKEKKPEDLPVKPAFITDHDFFNPAAAPQLIGAAMAHEENPYEFLKSNGVSSPHGRGLFEEAFDEMLVELDGDLDDLDEAAFYRVMHWLQPKPSVKAVTTRAKAIDAIVLPLENEKNHPLRDQVERFLIGAFGDPRVNQTEWRGVSTETLNIINRWLTSKSLKMFFDIINKFEDSHMWEPRRKFWMSMDKRELIDNAWVVLNPKGTEHAEQLARENDDPGFRSHGRVGFKEFEKCFFIMKIGALTVVEGTHNFKVRIHDGDAENPPRLMEDIYAKHTLYSDPQKTGDGTSFPHDASGAWQQKTDTYIRLNR